jgi:hypothetical protein
MRSSPGWRLGLASGLICLCLGCGDPAGSGGNTGGVGGMSGPGGAGGACTTDAINACLDLQNCCRAILVNPVFFQSCNNVVLQCDEQLCNEVLAGYVRCQDLEL